MVLAQTSSVFAIVLRHFSGIILCLVLLPLAERTTLLREVVESPSLKIFESHLVLGNML